MPATMTLPVYMRLGENGTEALVGSVTFSLDGGDVTSDLGQLEAAIPQMIDESPELQAIGAERVEPAP